MKTPKEKKSQSTIANREYIEVYGAREHYNRQNEKCKKFGLWFPIFDWKKSQNLNPL